MASIAPTLWSLALASVLVQVLVQVLAQVLAQVQELVLVW